MAGRVNGRDCSNDPWFDRGDRRFPVLRELVPQKPLDRKVAGLYISALQANGAIAQLGERNTGSVEVGGSIPPGSTKSKGIRFRTSAGFFL